VLIDPASIGARERYQLLTSLVVPRPIAWVSSRGGGVPNLAPFSYYAALSATPMLVGISIGSRRGQFKDTLLNIRESRCFCINVVADELLAPMNASAGDHPSEIDEFEVAGLAMAVAERVDAPYVEDCPAVFECSLFQEVPLGEASTLVIGEVVAVRLGPELHLLGETHLVDPLALRPVARLGGDLYTRLGEVVALPRPRIE
jgi:flavin reductase (DIM6/NTAB) family NADH-FMN oxidoreductase RutF